MPIIKESDLPGIGKKFAITLHTNEEFIIIIHDDGRREIYANVQTLNRDNWDEEDDDDFQLLAEMEDGEARQIAGILGGLSYKPKALEDMKISLHNMCIQWYKIEKDAPICNKTIGELEIRKKMGLSIIAVIENNENNINPGPNFTFHAKQILVVVGERENFHSFKELLGH